MDIKKFTIGRPVMIKTDDDIYNSYISAITLSDENFVYFKSGNLRTTLLDKLKSDKDKVGNKLDVSGGEITGNLNVLQKLSIQGNEVLTSQNIIIGTEFETGRIIEGKKEYGKKVDVDSLPNKGGLYVTIGASGATKWTGLRGMAYASGSVLPLPYASPENLSKNIEMYFAGSQVRIVTNYNYSSYSGEIEVYYVK